MKLMTVAEVAKKCKYQTASNRVCTRDHEISYRSDDLVTQSAFVAILAAFEAVLREHILCEERGGQTAIESRLPKNDVVRCQSKITNKQQIYPHLLY